MSAPSQASTFLAGYADMSPLERANNPAWEEVYFLLLDADCTVEDRGAYTRCTFPDGSWFEAANHHHTTMRVHG